VRVWFTCYTPRPFCLPRKCHLWHTTFLPHRGPRLFLDRRCEFLGSPRSYTHAKGLSRTVTLFYTLTVFAAPSPEYSPCTCSIFTPPTLVRTNRATRYLRPQSVLSDGTPSFTGICVDLWALHRVSSNITPRGRGNPLVPGSPCTSNISPRRLLL